MTSPNTVDWSSIKTIFLAIVVVLTVVSYIGYLSYGQEGIHVMSYLRHFKESWNATKDQMQKQNSTIHIAVVICGDRLKEGIAMLKSAVILSNSYLVFHVFTEENHRQTIQKEIEGWKTLRLKLTIHKIEFPAQPDCKTCSNKTWASLFRPCAAQRLFIPDILLGVDSLIYMDTDTLFLSPVESVWSQFSNFESHHIFGIVPEMTKWYTNHPIPHCGNTGVNSGVVLMNLTRAREVKWIVKITEYFESYRKSLLLGDQDLINIYCHFYPESFYDMPCEMNYRFFKTNGTCTEAHSKGIFILHANDRAYYRMQVLGQIFAAFKQHNIAKHSPQDLYDNILKKIQPLKETGRGKNLEMYTRNLQKYIWNHTNFAPE